MLGIKEFHVAKALLEGQQDPRHKLPGAILSTQDGFTTVHAFRTHVNICKYVFE